ncbi:MAG TPA: hypothetical protein VK585_17960, partial [Jiangellaceae bacterium]|nr:hypothetical protein [Jiangellaceae bacterium]
MAERKPCAGECDPSVRSARSAAPVRPRRGEVVSEKIRVAVAGIERSVEAGTTAAEVFADA